MHGIYIILLTVVSRTLTRGHSDSAEETIQLWIISTTKRKQAMQIKLAATVGSDK